MFDVFTSQSMVYLRCLSRYFRYPRPALPKDLSSLPYQTIDTGEQVEEGRLHFYDHEQFYPVHIGDAFKSRYQVVGKLCYGTYCMALP